MTCSALQSRALEPGSSVLPRMASELEVASRRLERRSAGGRWRSLWRARWTQLPEGPQSRALLSGNDSDRLSRMM